MQRIFKGTNIVLIIISVALATAIVAFTQGVLSSMSAYQTPFSSYFYDVFSTFGGTFLLIISACVLVHWVFKDRINHLINGKKGKRKTTSA